MAITEAIPKTGALPPAPDYTEPNQQVYWQSSQTWDMAIEVFQIQQNTTIDAMNEMSTQMNTLAEEVSVDEASAEQYAQDAKASADDAAISVDEIKDYVVPTEATIKLIYDDNGRIRTDSGTYIQTLPDTIYMIGDVGSIGFGVATCPDSLLPSGWTALSGHDNKTSPNYGNYLDLNGSILVYIPKHYFKWVLNELHVSSEPLDGYVLDRSFVNAGAELNGVFIYKYGAVNDAGIFASKAGLDPVSTHVDHNPIGNLNGTPINNYGGLYTAVKTASADHILTPIFHYSMLARLSFAQGKAATSTTACAYIDVAPLQAKGNNNNALKDVNDTSVTFTGSGYSNCALTGSGVPFAKTTHNGQECGIADLNGNMYEVASGFIRYDVDGFLVLKESVDIKTILNDSNTQGAGGAYDKDLYDIIDISDIVSANDGWIDLGNGTETVFAMNIDMASDEYKRTALGIANANGVSASGTTEFGNDGLYRHLRNEMACPCGGGWNDFSAAGVFALALGGYRTSSNYDVGGRASFLV